MRVADIVPQVFYDIIARVIPGGILMFTGWLVFCGYQDVIAHIKGLVVGDTYHVSFLFPFYLLLSSYAVSVIVQGVW